MLRGGLVLAAGGALSVLLGGCSTFGQRLSADDQVKLINALASAGCVTSGSLTAGASTGQLGGQASFGFTFAGNCDPVKLEAAKHPAPVVVGTTNP